MKYSIFTHVPWPENTDPVKLLTYAADEVRLAKSARLRTWRARLRVRRTAPGRI